MTRKIVSEMTYNVFSGTLNSTIPYHTIPVFEGWDMPTCKVGLYLAKQHLLIL